MNNRPKGSDGFTHLEYSVVHVDKETRLLGWLEKGDRVVFHASHPRQGVALHDQATVVKPNGWRVQVQLDDGRMVWANRQHIHKLKVTP